MEELMALLKKKDNPNEIDQGLVDNLKIILKQNYGKLRKFKFTRTNHKLHFNGNLEERALVFKQEVLAYRNKYSDKQLERFFLFWSEPDTKTGTKMKWELQKTWSVGNRLGYFYSESNPYNNH